MNANEKIKVVVSAGGLGTRVPEFTGRLMPKSLCLVSDSFPLPLISFQLRVLENFGCKDVFISLNQDWQIVLFEQFVRAKLIPQLNYTFGLHAYGDPLKIFTNQQVWEFLGNDDFIWTYGDLFYKKKLLVDLISQASKTNTSVATKIKSNGTMDSIGKKRTTFIIDNNIVTGYNEEAVVGNFTLQKPIFFKSDNNYLIREELLTTEPKFENILKSLTKMKKLSAVKPSILININLPGDLIKFCKVLSQ